MKGSCLLQAFQEARGGVSESFQVRKVLGYLSPFTASAEAMDSSSAISSVLGNLQNSLSSRFMRV